MRARHIQRAIRYAGINFGDWHAGQILCPPINGAPDGKFEYELVCIDFGFALQPKGDDHGCPPLPPDQSLYDVIVFNKGLLSGLAEDVYTKCSVLWEELDFPDEY